MIVISGPNSRASIAARLCGRIWTSIPMIRLAEQFQWACLEHERAAMATSVSMITCRPDPVNGLLSPQADFDRPGEFALLLNG